MQTVPVRPGAPAHNIDSSMHLSLSLSLSVSLSLSPPPKHPSVLFPLLPCRPSPISATSALLSLVLRPFMLQQGGVADRALNTPGPDGRPRWGPEVRLCVHVWVEELLKNFWGLRGTPREPQGAPGSPREPQGAPGSPKNRFQNGFW